MKLENITPLILTFNEEANIGRCLDKLKWAKTVFIIDSSSTDSTTRIACSYPNVQILARNFDTHANQWNFGLSKVTTDWVLTLDADYILSSELLAEIESLDTAISSCFLTDLKYCIDKQPLHCSLLPARPTLFKVKDHSYFDDGHTQRLTNTLEAHKLQGLIFHDDRKSLKRWFKNQLKYSVLESRMLAEKSFFSLPTSARLRRIPFLLPVCLPVYILFYKKGYKDGLPGLKYLMQRMLAESLISFELFKAYFYKPDE